MANPHRGEVALEVDGEVHVLRFSTNAVCALEADLGGKSVEEIGEMLAKRLSLTTARAFVRAAMRERSPNATLEDAGRLMDTAGQREAIEAAARAFELAFPQGEAKGVADPRASAGGAG